MSVHREFACRLRDGGVLQWAGPTRLDPAQAERYRAKYYPSTTLVVRTVTLGPWVDVVPAELPGQQQLPLCRDCERPLRPQHTRADDWPGTTVRWSAAQCQTCAMREKRRGKVE